MRNWLSNLRDWFSALHWLGKALLLIPAVVICVRVLIIILYGDAGLGFSGRFVNGEYIPAKSLWDWLNLLIVPLILAGGVIAINTAIQRGEQKRADEREHREQEQAENRAKVDRQIADDRLQEQTLQTYLDRMSELLLGDHFDKPATWNRASKIARAQTLTTLRTLNSDRRAAVLLFLYESGLIIGDTPPVSLNGAIFGDVNLQDFDLKAIRLEGAKLNGAALSGTHFEAANLSNVSLFDAHLWETHFEGANLEGAILFKTDLNRTHLEGANLKGASTDPGQLDKAFLDENTILPDGSHYKPPTSAAAPTATPQPPAVQPPVDSNAAQKKSS